MVWFRGVWSRKRIATIGITAINYYDVAPDGKRIAALISVELPEAPYRPDAINLLCWSLRFACSEIDDKIVAENK